MKASLVQEKRLFNFLNKYILVRRLFLLLYVKQNPDIVEDILCSTSEKFEVSATLTSLKIIFKF